MCAYLPKLKQHLPVVLQTGEHSPVDDARAALYLYLRHKKVSVEGDYFLCSPAGAEYIQWC